MSNLNDEFEIYPDAWTYYRNEAPKHFTYWFCFFPIILSIISFYSSMVVFGGSPIAIGVGLGTLLCCYTTLIVWLHLTYPSRLFKNTENKEG